MITSLNVLTFLITSVSKNKAYRSIFFGVAVSFSKIRYILEGQNMGRLGRSIVTNFKLFLGQTEYHYKNSPSLALDKTFYFVQVQASTTPVMLLYKALFQLRF